ncbi:MAG: hypothetical protein IT258_19075 [Saprospiraceae bacterium]|nr:hypothetical protein [Saprospiraceae bacterium]
MAKGEATVIPVIIHSSAWEKASFGKLNALPEKGVPVEKWEAWAQVVKRISPCFETVGYCRDKLACPGSLRRIFTAPSSPP